MPKKIKIVKLNKIRAVTQGYMYTILYTYNTHYNIS